MGSMKAEDRPDSDNHICQISNVVQTLFTIYILFNWVRLCVNDIVLAYRNH